MKEEEETWHSYKTKKKKLPYVQTQAEEAERERAVDGGGGMDSRRTCVDVIWSSVMHWERKRWEEKGWRRAPQGGPTVGARGLIPKTAVFTGEGGQRPGPCEMGALFGLVRMTLCSLCTLCWWYTPSTSISVGVWRLKLVWFSLRCIHKLNFTRCSCKKNKNIGKTLTFSDRFCVFVAHCWPTLIEPLEMQLTPSVRAVSHHAACSTIFILAAAGITWANVRKKKSTLFWNVPSEWLLGVSLWG